MYLFLFSKLYPMLKIFVMIAMLASACVYADYDPRDDPNSPQNRAAAQRAKKANAEAKVARDAANVAQKAKRDKDQAEMYRTMMKDSAKGMTDDQVRAAYPAFAKAQEAAAYKGAADAYRKVLGDRTNGLDDKQVVALMSDSKVQKEMMADQQTKMANAQKQFATMLPADRAMFERNSGMTIEQMQKMLAQTQAQAQAQTQNAKK
jgi:hypothetical protein